jgi:hypothetical protein
MKFNLKKKEKKEFKPFNLVMTFESKDEILAFITLLDNTEIQTWSKAPKLCKILKEQCDTFI